MELKDTIDMMCSSDYKERFVAEYKQLVIRLQKLEIMVFRYKYDLLSFKPVCPLHVLQAQLNAMAEYAQYLRERAVLENIDLWN